MSAVLVLRPDASVTAQEHGSRWEREGRARCPALDRGGKERQGGLARPVRPSRTTRAATAWNPCHPIGDPMAKLDGHCLCGQIAYTSDAEPIMTAVCHCADCQRQTGTTFSLVVAVPRDQLRIHGTPKVFQTMGDDRGAPA